jgi:hypothetical protein
MFLGVPVWYPHQCTVCLPDACLFSIETPHHQNKTRLTWTFGMLLYCPLPVSRVPVWFWLVESNGLYGPIRRITILQADAVSLFQQPMQQTGLICHFFSCQLCHIYLSVVNLVTVEFQVGMRTFQSLREALIDCHRGPTGIKPFLK